MDKVSRVIPALPGLRSHLWQRRGRSPHRADQMQTPTADDSAGTRPKTIQRSSRCRPSDCTGPRSHWNVARGRSELHLPELLRRHVRRYEPGHSCRPMQAQTSLQGSKSSIGGFRSGTGRVGRCPLQLVISGLEVWLQISIGSLHCVSDLPPRQCRIA